MHEVLLIEDDLDINDGLVTLLQLEGYRVESAINAPDGVQLAFTRNLWTRHRPDIVLCDVVMGQHSGYDVLKAWRELGMSVPFIFLTAQAQTADIEKGLRSGANTYITKPFDFAELLEKIKQLIEKTEPPLSLWKS